MPVPRPCSKWPLIPNASAQRSDSYPSCTHGGPTCCPIIISTQSFPAADCRPITSAGFIPAIRCSRSEEHTSELQSLRHLVCRLLLEKKKTNEPRQTDPGTFNSAQPFAHFPGAK